MPSGRAQPHLTLSRLRPRNSSSWGMVGGRSTPRTGEEVRNLLALGATSRVIRGPQPRHDLLQRWPWGRWGGDGNKAASRAPGPRAGSPHLPVPSACFPLLLETRLLQVKPEPMLSSHRLAEGHGHPEGSLQATRERPWPAWGHAMVRDELGSGRHPGPQQKLPALLGGREGAPPSPTCPGP